MARTKRKRAQCPLINLVLILFFVFAMNDSGTMARNAFSENITHATLAALYLIGSLLSLIALILKQRGILLWVLVTILLTGGLIYLISLKAIAWICAITVLLIFWLKADNRQWHRLSK
jgi:lysylphosphatidylglycerol synthetase-like protein (DUF2156 family)